MFGFIGKFKQQVISGFDSVHQRLVTLEAKVEALFEHTKQTVQADVAKAEQFRQGAKDASKVEAAVETVVNDAKQV